MDQHENITHLDIEDGPYIELDQWIVVDGDSYQLKSILDIVKIEAQEGFFGIHHPFNLQVLFEAMKM